jgi:type VI secretion system protein ImpA
VAGSRREAKLAIEKVCAYFEQYEPSSPVPLVLKGAVRLIGRPFHEIYDILPPDKVQMLRQVAETPESGG